MAQTVLHQERIEEPTILIDGPIRPSNVMTEIDNTFAFGIFSLCHHATSEQTVVSKLFWKVPQWTLLLLSLNGNTIAGWLLRL